MKPIIRTTLLLLALLLPTTATAYDFFFDGIYFNIINGNEAEVTYESYDGESIHSTYSGDVNIPRTVTCNGTTYLVTSIGERAFFYCSGLTSVKIPSSVTSIGEMAFSGCSGLTTVRVSNTVTTIGQGAFSGTAWFDNQPDGLVYVSHVAYKYKGEMPAGTNITIWEGISSITDYCFDGCSGLTSITIPNSVTTIGQGAFSGTAWYNNQPDGLVYAGLVAYQYKGEMPAGTNITIREGTHSITGYCFYYYRGLTSVTIPNSVTTIGQGAFYECSGLTSVTIPNSVTSIGYCAFFGCSGLTSVTIPNSVTSIDTGAFYNCSGLTSVTIGNSVTTIGGAAFRGCSCLTSVEIPNSVTTIGQGAFYECSGLTSVTIGNSVTTIGNSAFYGCSCLTSIIVDGGNPKYDSRDNCNAIIETSSNTLVFGCKNTIIPNSVTTIGDWAFYNCSGLTSVTVPNSVTSIGENAFFGCSGLTSVTIGNSVTSIGGGAFRGCSCLTSVEIPNSVTTIGDWAFYNCSGLTSVTIGNSVTFIGYRAFYECSGLTSVTCLATTPPRIGYNSDYAFPSYVTRQATLYVPNESVSAYQSAYNWKDFSIIVAIISVAPGSTFEVDGIYYRAISDSTACVIANEEVDNYYTGDVVIPEAVTYGNYSFTVVSIDAGAFEDCYDLASVVIGDSVESIGENAFQGCTALTSVTIGSRVTAIGSKAFNYCNALQTVTCLGMEPPVMASSNCFTNATYTRATLRLHRLVIDAYTAADYWYKFVNIEGYGSSGPGDVNGDGIIGIADVTAIIDYILGNTEGEFYVESADVNGNGIVNIADVTELIDLLLGN